MGIEGQNYGFATAIGLFNSIITFILVFAANTLTRRLTKMSLW
jgi:putative aldouronate transport system permease protein